LKISMSMTPRGEMGLIIASLGLTSGLISTKTYSIGVVAVILTTFIAIPILKNMLSSKKDKSQSDFNEQEIESCDDTTRSTPSVDGTLKSGVSPSDAAEK
jgi:predicted Kef-type K+ transport protein